MSRHYNMGLNANGLRRPRKVGFGINSNGYLFENYMGTRVYYHRKNVEDAIGRKLLPGEVVHHVDKNKRNNNIENLMLFKSNSDHIQYHGSSNHK